MDSAEPLDSNNVAYDAYTTIGGGTGNQAGTDTAFSNYAATVGGGKDNAAFAAASTISGGEENATENFGATVGGGHQNVASGFAATVGGGLENVAEENGAAVGGGHENVASGFAATVGGGLENVADSHRSTVGGGEHNEVHGDHGTVAGGEANEVAEEYATVPGGSGAKANHYGQLAYASGSFDEAGDAQASTYVLRNETNEAEEPTLLYLDGGEDERQISINEDQAFVFDIQVVALHTGASNPFAAWCFDGMIYNHESGVEIDVELREELGMANAFGSVEVNKNISEERLEIEVEADEDDHTHWVATVRTTETALP